MADGSLYASKLHGTQCLSQGSLSTPPPQFMKPTGQRGVLYQSKRKVTAEMEKV